MTPQEIQLARERAQRAVDREARGAWVPLLAAELARAVLALTEQHPECTCEYPYPREIWDGHHSSCATEQQPEPELPTGWHSMADAPRDGTVIDGYYGADEIVRIRWSAERVCMPASTAPGAGGFGPGWEDDANHLYMDDPTGWREQQPEPVSRDELLSLLVVHGHDPAKALLSRYSITRKAGA